MPFKDTPDGSTHYVNDGCGEPAHNEEEKPEERPSSDDSFFFWQAIESTKIFCF